MTEVPHSLMSCFAASDLANHLFCGQAFLFRRSLVLLSTQRTTPIVLPCLILTPSSSLIISHLILPKTGTPSGESIRDSKALAKGTRNSISVLCVVEQNSKWKRTAVRSATLAVRGPVSIQKLLPLQQFTPEANLKSHP